MARSFFSEFKLTLSYCGGQRRFYTIALISLILVDFADVAAPFLIKLGVGAATGMHQSEMLREYLPDAWFEGKSAFHGMWVWGAIYLAVVLFAGFFRYWMSISISQAAINIAHRTRNRLYRHVQALPASWHDHATTGKIMALATNDLDACRFFWGIGLLLAVDTALYMVYTPIFMFSISPMLTLMCLLPAVLLMPWSISKIAKKIEEKFEHVQEQFSILSDQASESFHGAKVVKSFAAEAQEIQRYRSLSERYRMRALGLAIWQRLEDPLLILFIGIMQLVVLGYGGYLVLEGEIGPDDFVAFFFFLLRLAFPMMELGFVIAIYQRCVVSRRRIEAVITEPLTIASKADALKPATCKGELEFKNLTFAYKGADNPALRDVNLRIPAGATVAFMGEVGAGKSTILGLAARLYDAPEGAVLLDGVALHDLDLEWLRNQVACVPQETFLFSETILENIGFGAAAEDRNDEELKAYARIARIEEDILGFPKGYQTLLGERGVNLSGGQKQRVAIARALACRPAILVLDDCLSAVDAATERAIFDALSAEVGSRTCLISSHRVSAVRNADIIVVLEKGQVIEQGSHAELMKLGGWYADLTRKQALEAAIDSED